MCFVDIFKLVDIDINEVNIMQVPKMTISSLNFNFKIIVTNKIKGIVVNIFEKINV